MMTNDNIDTVEILVGRIQKVPCLKFGATFDLESTSNLKENKNEYLTYSPTEGVGISFKAVIVEIKRGLLIHRSINFIIVDDKPYTIQEM